jgi:hypothetical protein
LSHLLDRALLEMVVWLDIKEKNCLLYQENQIHPISD